MFCEQCSHKMNSRAKFCEVCGTEAGKSAPLPYDAETNSSCRHCTMPMPVAATNCPSCGKLRHDIQKDKYWYYSFIGMMVFAFLLFMFGVSKGGGGWTESSYSLSSGFTRHFSLSAFLSSGPGLIIFLLYSVGFLGSFVYYVKASRKLGSWVWF